MSADNYLFIDRETNRVYHRFASSVYGGFSEDAIRSEEPAYEGVDYKDAACWASRFEPVEYGVYVGTLCPDCETEVSSEDADYPRCPACSAFENARQSLGDAAVINALQEKLRPNLR